MKLRRRKQELPARFEKQSEIKHKKNEFFSNETKEQHYNLKRTDIIQYMRGAFPSPIPTLVTLQVFSVFKKFHIPIQQPSCFSSCS